MKRRTSLTILMVLGALISRSPDATAQSSTQYGLEWLGDGSARRMLYWHNPFPIYDATYVFKVYPRKKTSGAARYYTTFFWGNDGNFVWDGGFPNTYYGAHPYPIPAPTGPGQWEISVWSGDYVTGKEVEWNRWHTQVFRAWRESSTVTHHEFYWDWPDTSKVISKTIVSNGWAKQNPPTPAIVMGQAPNLNGASWGGYPGWEEFNGVIRGIQMYSGLLSLADLQAEIATPKSSTAGRNLIWYLNLDPRPGDVSDKKDVGTPHNPSWAGTTALEWSAQGAPAPAPPPPTQPAAPTISGVAAANLTGSSATIAWATNEAADSQVDYGVTTAYGQSAVNPSLVTAHSVSLSGLAAGTVYHYRVKSRNAAGNATTSSDFTFTTVVAGDTSPPAISAVAATNITTSGAMISWQTSEPADSQVEYGTTAAYGQSTTIQPSLVNSHSMSLTALSADTTYHFRVRSKDGANNSSTGTDFTFRTTPSADSETESASAALASYGFNEALGSVTADASGHGFGGTLVNNPVWTSGRSANALVFDGVNDKVSLPSSLDIAKLPFTLEAWIMPTSRSDWRGIFSKRSSYSRTQMRFDVGLAIYTGRVYVTTAQSVVTFAYAPPLNNWSHIAVVAESSGTKLYVNGALKQTLAPVFLGSKANAPVVIGNTGDNDDPFAGIIDELRLYDRALGAGEIQADMTSTSF